MPGAQVPTQFQRLQTGLVLDLFFGRRSTYKWLLNRKLIPNYPHHVRMLETDSGKCASHYKKKTTIEIWPVYRCTVTGVQSICTAKHLGGAKCVYDQVCLFVCLMGWCSPQSSKNNDYFFVLFCFCIEGWCQPLVRWLLIYPYPQTPRHIPACRSVFFKPQAKTDIRSGVNLGNLVISSNMIKECSCMPS